MSKSLRRLSHLICSYQPAPRSSPCATHSDSHILVLSLPVIMIWAEKELVLPFPPPRTIRHAADWRTPPAALHFEFHSCTFSLCAELSGTQSVLIVLLWLLLLLLFLFSKHKLSIGTDLECDGGRAWHK